MRSPATIATNCLREKQRDHWVENRGAQGDCRCIQCCLYEDKHKTSLQEQNNSAITDNGVSKNHVIHWQVVYIIDRESDNLGQVKEDNDEPK